MRTNLSLQVIFTLFCCCCAFGASDLAQNNSAVPIPTLKVSVSPDNGTAPFTMKGYAACGASDPCATYMWQFSDGSPVTIGASVTHTFTTAGVFPVTVTATDAAANSTTAQYSVRVSAASGADNRYCKSDGTWVGTSWNNPVAYDGPAALPRFCVLTAPWSLPSPGTVIPVAGGQDLMAAYNAASCGQTLALAHGSTWKGPFNFAAKNCDDKHWITITSDGALPPVGSRVHPKDAPQIAKFSIKSGFTMFGDHIRLIGIEWTKVPGPILYGFVDMKGANKIVIERNYFHGNPGEETQHGVIVNTGKSIAVIDSYLEELHCIAKTGACTDAQAIGGGSGNAGDLISQSGPVKIVNNYLSASGENILFGGGTADGCGPSDIEIRRNHLYKPPAWNPLDPNYIGTAYIVKNLLEFKNGCRALVEGNVMENSWGGFSQGGYAVLLTPKNQAGDDGTNLCPNCEVTDITVRYNFIRSVAGPFAWGGDKSSNNGWSQGLHRVSIHDDIADNLQYETCYQCGLTLMKIGSSYDAANPPPANEVTTDVAMADLTVVATRTVASSGQANALLNIGGVPPNVSTPQASDISFQNSIVATQRSGMYTSGGGTNNCTYWVKSGLPAKMWPGCFVGSSPFSGNVLVGYAGSQTDWPPGNSFSPDWETVGFVDFQNDSERDFHLSSGSPFKSVGVYGRDPGADVDAVSEMTKGVRESME